MNKSPDHPEKFIDTIKTRINTIHTNGLSFISSDPLLKGIIILGSGTVISQVLSILFVPILTRIYPPEVYGTLAVFTSLLTILLVGSSFKYELTIPIAENDEDAETLLLLSLLIACILSVILFVVLTIWGNFLAVLFHFEFMMSYYWLFCVGFFGIALYQILTYWTLRTKDYARISQTRVAQSISGSVSKIILGLLSLGSFGLIFGEIIGRLVGISTLGKTILPKIWRSARTINFTAVRTLAVRYKRFPTYSLPAGFISETILQVPTLFLSSTFGFQIVGLYILSYSMLELPVSLISNSIVQAFFGESSALLRNKSDKLLSLYQETTKKLFLFGAPIIFLGAVISPVVFPIVFGSAWNDAGLFSLPLSIMVIAQFVVASTDRLEMYGFNQWELIWNICRTIFVLLGLYLALHFGLSAVNTILLYSLIMTFMYAICYFLNIQAIRKVMKRNDAAGNSPLKETIF
jgi:O-antigen/teichoic acid export membrane protein